MPAAALPRGVLSLFQSGSDDSPSEEVVYVRFSDLLRRAPLAVLEGAAALLLARVYRRKASGALTEPYLEYARSDRTRSRMNRMRRGAFAWPRQAPVETISIWTGFSMS